MGFITPQQKWQKEELKHWFDTGFDSIKTNGLFNFLIRVKLPRYIVNIKRNIQRS